MGVLERKMETHGIHSVPAPTAEPYLVIQDSGAGRREVHQDAMGPQLLFPCPPSGI